MVVAWHFELLPRWAIALVVARELFMLGLSRYGAAPRRRAQDQLAGPARGRADDGRAVLRDGRRPLAGADPALRRAGAGADGDRAVRAQRHAAGREREPHQALKLSLTLWDAGVYSRFASPLDLAGRGGAHRMDTFPDLGSLTDQELKDLIKQLTEEEMEISYQRRILHGKIDILRAELVNRLRKKDESGELVISGADVQQLTDILAGRVPGARTPSRRTPQRRGPALPRVRLRQRRRRQLLPAVRRVPRAVRAAAGRDDRDLPGRRDRRARGGRARATSSRAARRS